MSTAHPDFVSTVEQVEGVPVVSSRKAISNHRCLVVSTSQKQRAMLSKAALDGGWGTVVCSDAGSALTEFRRHRFQLIFIDLVGTGTASDGEFRNVCHQLTAEGRDLLLVVCGRQADPREEIWARQLGIWLYLAGVTEERAVTELCDEARGVVERLNGKVEGKTSRV